MPESTPIAGRAPLLLLNDPHVRWHSWGDPQRAEPNVSVRGFAWVGNRHLEGESLALHLQRLAAQSRDALRQEISRLNGGWALVAVWPSGETLVAVDRMRTIPLFYCQQAESFAVADSAIDLARRFSLPMSRLAQLKFLAFGYVSGSRTLYEGVEQLQSGEILYVRSDGDCLRERYYRFYPAFHSSASRDELESQLAETVDRMIDRLRAGIGGRRIIVPLSGGLDSRLVAAMVKRAGVEDCLCYTFGDEAGEEATISKQVAEAIGLPWRCFPYSNEEWTKWNTSEIFRDYQRYACKGVSKSITHDFPALMKLVEEGLDPQQAIFFPGHTGDMVSGGHIRNQYQDLDAGRIDLVDEIVSNHAGLLWIEPQRLLRGRLGRQVLEELKREATPPNDAVRDNTACYELWDAEQRQPNYIINNVRVYEFVGAGWRTLWDYELMDFFLRVPKELRFGQRLYLSCLRDRIFVDDLAPLKQIPLAGRGLLTTTKSFREPAKNRTPVENAKRKLKQQLRWWKATASGKLQLDEAKNPIFNATARLAGLGIGDGSISFGDFLDAKGLLSRLDSDIRQILTPWLRFRLDSLHLLGVFTAITLAEMSCEEGT